MLGLMLVFIKRTLSILGSRARPQQSDEHPDPPLKFLAASR